MPKPIIEAIYFILTFATKIKTKPFRKINAEVEKLFGRIKEHITIKGAKTYKKRNLKSLISCLYLLNCLAMNNKIESLAISDG